MVFFVSDLHYNAQRTIDISKRPFNSLQELNKTLINNWNKTVSKDDIVYILGDFGDFWYAQFLNGYKVFCKGNYERGYYTDEYLNQFFDCVVKDDILPMIISHKGKVYELLMTHEPMNFSEEVRNAPLEPYKINLFGHIHKLCLVKRFGYNVSCDCHNYTPISIDDILFYHNAAMNYYDDNVFY